MGTVEVKNRTVGGNSKKIPDLEPVFLELLEEQITVKELIQRTVEEQVRDLVVRRKLNNEQIQEILDRQYLLNQEIDRQVEEQGRVRFPQKWSSDSLKIDIDQAIKTAWEAFGTGRYMILVDGEQMEDLEQVIRFGTDTKVVFLRLTPLVGG